MSQTRFTISGRFRGPKDSGNGGYAAGCFAQAVDFSPARVTLLKPPPLEEELIVEMGERGFIARTGAGAIVAACSPGQIDLEVPSIPSLEEAREASTRFVLAQDHFFPECFVCGTDRASGDGLRIYPGQVQGREIVATCWRPDALLGSGANTVDAAIVWAALDCPGGIAVFRRGIKPMVLGKICVELREPVRTEQDLVVMGWSVATNGAKEHVGSAIADGQGRILAVAEATWIVLSEEQRAFALGVSSD